MTDDKLEKIESDEHVQWLIREERREIYQIVAEASIYRDDDGDMYWKPGTTKIVAEAIYQGMVKFCGEAK